MQLSAEEIERERSIGRIAGIGGIIGLILFIVSFQLAGDFGSADSAEQLRIFPDNDSAVLVQSLIQFLAIALFAPPLFLLYRATTSRYDKAPPGLKYVMILGPLLLAISIVIGYFAYKAGSKAFLDPSAGNDLTSNDDARDVLNEQFARQLQTGIGIAGALGTGFAIAYASLHSSRAGLMTRFWGTFGIALGVASILFGPILLVVFFLIISLIVADLWPGGRPPAWAAGTAVPWPDPRAPVPEPDPEEPANPEDFEGTATEVKEPVRPARRDNKRKRKRKQRG